MSTKRVLLVVLVASGVMLAVGVGLRLPVAGSAAGMVSHGESGLIQTSVTLTPVADASIDAAAPNTPHGNNHTLEVYYGGENEIGRALIRFNLAAAVPSDAIIDEARLDLYLEYGDGADPVNLVAANLTEDWVESEVTWNTPPATGEPTVATLVDTTSGYKSLGVTEIVQAWHNVPHYGLELSGPEGETDYSRIFESREPGEHPPQLVVTYHLPTLSGRVYAGNVGDESTPLSDVTVELYCSNNADDLGTLIASTTTNAEGWYELTASGVCEFYNILETDPADYTSVGATTVSGVVVTSNWIQYAYPLEGKTLTGNKFWDRRMMPDLVVTEIECDRENDRIGYRIENIGEATAPASHHTALFVKVGEDWEEVCEDHVDVALNPGEDYQGWFDCYTWPECRTIEVRVCADRDNTVEESDEDNNCMERICECVPEEKPDLVITDVWNEDSTICYQIRNIGEVVTPRGHYTALFVDDDYRVSDLVNADLEPGERWRGCFDHEWECTPPEDSIAIWADYEDSVAESDETNNFREEIWKCDITPPEIISGPTVLDVTQNSAVIFWETDEDSDSVVQYGKTAGQYAFEETDSTLVREHSITLTNLEPSTTYHFVVWSTDPSGNTVESTDNTFETLPLPDDTDPIVTILDPGVCRGTITVIAEASDDTGVEKVEFYLDEELVFTDYSPPYEFTLNTTDYANGEHTLRAKAYDLSGRSIIDDRGIDIVNVIDVTAPSVTITAPNQWDTVSGKTTVSANLIDDRGLADAVFYVDGVQIGFNAFPADTITTTAQLNWDTSEADNGSHRIGVKAYDLEGKTALDTVDVTVYNAPPPAQPKLVVTEHKATRIGNGLVISLTVKNVGASAARNVFIRDYSRSLQPISRDTTIPILADYRASFIPSTGEGNCGITDYVDIAQGESRTYTYAVIPVLMYPNPPTPLLGHLTRLWYEGPDGTKHSGEFKIKVLQTTGGEAVSTAYNNAAKQADYLIVTHPQRLYSRYMWYNVDALLSEMAQLAVYQQGVLGYLGTYDKYTLDKLIEPNGGWAKKMHADFGKPLKGYLLIVGETEIVPGWSRQLNHHWGPINYSDHNYADTTGDDIPDLIVGRAIGDSAAALAKPIEVSNGVYASASGYAFDRDVGLVMSDPGVGPFNKTADYAGNCMLQNGFNQTRTLHFEEYFVASSFAFSYDVNGFAVGDVTGSDDVEVIIAEASANKIWVLNASGNLVGWFIRDFEQGDVLAVGDVIGDAKAEIIIGDLSADKIAIHGTDATPIYEFSRPFDAGDDLAVGDVMGLGKGQILHGDQSADYIYVTEITGTAPGPYSDVHWGSVYASFDKYDRLLSGDALGDARDEVIIADISQNKIYVRTVGTGTWKWWEHKKGTGLEQGDGFAVGDVNGTTPGTTLHKDQILVADKSGGRIYVTSWDFGKNDWAWAGEIPVNLDGFGGIAVADVGEYLQTQKEEVLVAGGDDTVRILDTTRNWIWRIQDAFPGKVLNVDVIYWQGHGGPGAMDSAINSYLGPGHHEDEAVFPLDFNSHNPFVLATACFNGNYQDPSGGSWGGPESKNIAESFLASGASVFVGSTQVSAIALNREFGKKFFTEWDAHESIGEAFTAMEKALWPTNGGWKYWVEEYNLYGDPKFGIVSPPATENASGLAESESSEPPSSLFVEVPDYEVSEGELGEGMDSVGIPGGHIWYQEGQLWVPLYSTSIDYPQGYRVEDAVLIERSGLVMDTGLNIPMTPLTTTPSTWDPVPYSGPVEGWFPEQEYRWETAENPDGSTTLTIVMYPFYYNPLTTDVRFYKHYSFDINYTVSPVAITNLTTDKDEYEQGDTVMVDIGISNEGEPQDVTVSAVIKQSGMEEVVDGLLLSTLDSLSGEASFSPQWDSTGFEPGYYYVEVTLQDTGDNVLDRRTEMFRLGISSGEITSFTATPAYFDIGDSINISLVFSNTGTVNIIGTAVIKIQDEASEIAQEFRHDVTDLAPGNAISFDNAWDTSGAEEGTYGIVGYVLYDSMATDPMTAVASTEARIYLPIVSKTYP